MKLFTLHDNICKHITMGAGIEWVGKYRRRVMDTQERGGSLLDDSGGCPHGVARKHLNKHSEMEN